MSVTREQVYDALLAQVETAGTTFQTYSRRWESVWSDPNEMYPLLPLVVLSDQTESVVWGNRGIGHILTLTVFLLVYAKLPDGSTPGVPDGVTAASSVLNPLIDALFTALAPTGPDGVQTLGDLVLDCRIEGDIAKVLADNDPAGQVGAVLPVTILMGGNL